MYLIVIKGKGGETSTIQVNNHRIDVSGLTATIEEHMSDKDEKTDESGGRSNKE